MGFLLDTHALLWWFHDPSRLSATARELISDTKRDMFVSAVSAIEIATKCRVGRLEFKTSLARDFVAQTEAEGFEALPVTAEHAQLAGSFINSHQDAWDRLLAAQAQLERLTLVTTDERMHGFGVTTLW